MVGLANLGAEVPNMVEKLKIYRCAAGHGIRIAVAIGIAFVPVVTIAIVTRLLMVF